MYSIYKCTVHLPIIGLPLSDGSQGRARHCPLSGEGRLSAASDGASPDAGMPPRPCQALCVCV